MIWHYQWMVLHEFLPLFIGESLVDDILTRGRKCYGPADEGAAFYAGGVPGGGVSIRSSHCCVPRTGPTWRATKAGHFSA